MKVGDLIRGDFWELPDPIVYGIIIATKEKEEIIYIKWLDSGEEIGYPCGDEEIMLCLELVSESR